MYCWLIFAIFAAFFSFTNCVHNRRYPIDNDRIYINEMIDDGIQDIRDAVKRFGFDPMKIPTIRHAINVSILWTTHTVRLNLTKGTLVGASTLERDGNFYIRFLPSSVIRLHVKVHLKELHGRFNYKYSTWAYWDQGVMNVTIKNVTAIMEIDYKLDNLTIINPQLKIKHAGQVTVSMKSNALFRWLANAIANVALRHFKSEVIIISERTVLRIANRASENANNHMAQYLSESILRFIQLLLPGDYNNHYNNG